MTPYKDANEQAFEYATRERARARRTKADDDMTQFFTDQCRRYGVQVAWGAMIRLVGGMLVALPESFLIRAGCLALTKYVARSTWRRLTRHRTIQ
jgi:hypothetical protein